MKSKHHPPSKLVTPPPKPRSQPIAPVAPPMMPVPKGKSTPY